MWFRARIAVGNLRHLFLSCTRRCQAHVLAAHTRIETTVLAELDPHAVAQAHDRSWLLL